MGDKDRGERFINCVY